MENLITKLLRVRNQLIFIIGRSLTTNLFFRNKLLGKNIFLWLPIILLSLVLLLPGACSAPTGQTANSTTSTSTLIVAAAASLTEAFTELAKSFEAENSAIKINFNFAASGLLQKQIEQGAPIDIFASASNKQMDALEKQNLLLSQTRKIFAKNQLVLVGNEQSSWIKKFSDLKDSRLKRLAIGNPTTVPAGEYAKAALNKENIYTQLEDQKKLIFGDNVRQVLTYVEQGNVDAAIIYLTDAAISNKVQVLLKIAIDPAFSISYPIAVIKQSKYPQQSQKFINFVISSLGQQILEKYGFISIK